MNFQARKWRRILPCVLVLALIVAAVPLPCAAQGVGHPAAKPGLKASIGPIARAMALDKPVPASRSSVQSPGDARTPESRSFFKTPIGVVVLAVVAAGAGYAVYSANHDRIAPTGR